jgi:hypothetical protein
MKWIYQYQNYFATTEVVTDNYIKKFEVSDAQAEEVEKGASLLVQDGKLYIYPVPTFSNPEPSPIIEEPFE